MTKRKTLPDGMDLSRVQKVIVVEGTLKNGGTVECVHIGVLESLSTVGKARWVAHLSGGITLTSDDPYVYEVVHVRETELTPASPTEAQRSVEFNTRGEGEMVLESLRAYLEKHGAVSRYEMLGVANITGDFTDNKWGWNDLSDARVTRTRQGTYMLDMPVAYEIQ